MKRIKISPSKKISKKDVSSIVYELKKGKLVIGPTDTVYGLFADASNDSAVKKLYQYRNQKENTGLAIFVNSIEEAKKYIEIDQKYNRILHTILPGSFTILGKSKNKLSSLLENEKKLLGFRYVKNNFIAQLLYYTPFPITATGAHPINTNPFSSINSLTHKISKKSLQMISMIVDCGKLPRKTPSTVIDFSDSDHQVYRIGSGDIKKIKREFISYSPLDSQKIIQDVVKTAITKNKHSKPIIIMLYGEVGAGKTILAKGLGNLFGIDDIRSPTYVVYYEYLINNNLIFSRMLHFDFYRIQFNDEFEYLELEEMIKPKTISIIEWAEKSGNLDDVIKDMGYIVSVYITKLGKNKRKFIIYQ